MPSDAQHDAHFRRVVAWVCGLNLVYFFVEFGVARWIGSVALLADSIDFLEDASINALILLALRWSAARRARVGMLLALILLVPSLATLWAAYQKLLAPAAPLVVPLTLAAAGAFIVNLTCAFMLARHRTRAGSLSRAAFLSARNDVLANIAIIIAGFITLWTRNGWPDLVVGLGIALLNAGAAKEVYAAARTEHDARA